MIDKRVSAIGLVIMSLGLAVSSYIGYHYYVIDNKLFIFYALTMIICFVGDIILIKQLLTKDK